MPKKKNDNPNLIYNRYSFYEYDNDEKLDKLSIESKY